MSIFAVLEPFFHALSDGKLIRITVAWVLRILAVIMALVGLFWFLALLRVAFRSGDAGSGGQSGAILLGSVLFAIFGLGWGYLAAGIFAFRARSVADLGDSHFTVLSILSILFRLNGELAFVTYSLLGVGGCLFVWFTNASPFSELGMFGDRLPFAESVGSGFVGGVELAIFMLLLAFACIVVSYALAELTVVWVEIALNTRGLLTLPVILQTPPAPVLVPAPPLAPPSGSIAPQIHAPVQRVCKKCGTPLDPGSIFCGECGTAAN